jgi:hypothetical protein
VSQGKIVYDDDSQPQRPEKTLAPVDFTLKDFQTNRAEGGAFTLNAKSERGEGFGWTGALSIAPVSSQGRITITGLQGSTIQQFAGKYLPITLISGAIGLDMHYDLSYRDSGLHLTLQAPELTVAKLGMDGKSLFHGTAQIEQFRTGIGQLELTDAGNGTMLLHTTVPQARVEGLLIAPHGNEAGQIIKLATATFKDVALDNRARKLSVGSLALSGADLSLRRENDGRINLVTLLPVKPAARAAQPPHTPQAPAWRFNLAAFTLENAKLQFEDRAVSPTALVNITPINLSLTGASSDLAAPVAMRLTAKIDGRASIEAHGTVTPANSSADVNFTISNLALRPLLAYGPPHPTLDIKSGNINASGRLQVRGGDSVSSHFAGNAALNDFSLYETNGNSELFAWEAFTFNHVSYGAKHLTIDRARLIHPFGRIVVRPDRTLNFQSLTAKNNSEEPAVAPVSSERKTASAAATSVPAAPPTPAVQIRVKELDVDDGTVSFADYSVQPNFEASINAVQGSITNISNLPDEVANIDLKGEVIDQYSPVAINGSMNLLAYDRQTNMHLMFRNIDLPVFNPYSGRYAGYAIAKGKLTTDITYKIENRALQADHHIIIDQLKWGQATASKEAVPMPIRLATTLLKDKNGVIDIHLPVTGSLDDRKFSLGPVISQILGNIVKKAVTAPFHLIGALFAGAEKAQYVDFSLGSAALPAASGDALGALAKTLADRPELEIDIPAGPATQEDALAIADAEIDRQATGDNTNQGRFAALPTTDQHKDLVNLYELKLGKKPEYPDFTPDELHAASNTVGLDENSRRQILETQWLHAQLQAAFAPSSAQLSALGTERAKAIRDALLGDGKVDPERVFIASDLKATAVDGRSRVELKIK